METAKLLDVVDVHKGFSRPDGSEYVVLDGVNLFLAQDEIVGLLGRSGSGKSTLLRLIAGLSKPGRGRLTCLGRAVNGPPEGVAMVFQSFALFPWLTVLANVEIGLEARGVPREERRRRALEAIDLIGLDGFESAFPRELSGGMRQRVGFARALVVQPEILLMDEPFSALDVLTAETLRTDFLDLWGEGQLPIKGVILVTHNIEEAVLMCDRILIFGSNPGRVLREIAVSLPQPRDRLDPEFRALVEEIYVEMTARRTGEAPASHVERFPGTGIATVLPEVSTNLMAGLLELVDAKPYDGKADLPDIATALRMEVDNLFPVAETLQMLRFVEFSRGDIQLSAEGRHFAGLGTDGRKALFARHLLTYVPLAGHIRRVLDERPNHTARWDRFTEELEDHMSPEKAERTLKAVVSWGRYAEAFAYDDNTKLLSLEDPD
jgi:NitT/TauT family transport system ATP-binding protein